MGNTLSAAGSNMRLNSVAEMLTAKDIQTLLQVDRSTVYRMAEAGRLPAIKVGRRWRFPADQFDSWFQAQISTVTAASNGASLVGPAPVHQSWRLAELLSWDWLEIIQETFADLLGTMLVVTDMEGRPINRPTHPCALYRSVSEKPGAMEKFVESWRNMVAVTDLTPAFRVSHLGLLSARSMIAVGTELKGMVLAGCIAPDEWPPSPTEAAAIAAGFDVPPDFLMQYVNDVYHLDKAQKERVLATIPRVATLIAHIIDERKILVDKLEAIANLSQLYRQ